MSQQLKQDITLLGGIGQLSTTLLGTGLFMIPAIAANIAGEWSLWAWIILLFAICPIALTFALMGRQYPMLVEQPILFAKPLIARWNVVLRGYF